MKARDLVRRPRALRTGAGALLLVAVLAATAYGAEGDRRVFGFITDAEATPVAIEYNQPTFGVPATPTFEVRFFHSETQSDSGPSSHGLASVVWPGDLAGNAPPQLAYDQMVMPYIQPAIDNMPAPIRDQLFTPVNEGIRGGLADAPSYPVRAEMFHPPQAGQSPSTQIGGGIGMRARAGDGLAEAQSTGNRAGFPGLFSVQNLNATSFSGIADGIAAANASTEIHDMSIFGGIVRVESFTNQMAVTSDGLAAELSGSIKVGGLTLTYPEGDGTTTMEIVALDESGVVIGGEPRMDWDEARAFFRERLEPYGLGIELLEREQSIAGAAGERAIAGLSIRMDARFLSAMREEMPEPVRTWLTSPGDSPLEPIYQGLPPEFDPLLGLGDSLIALDQSITLVLGNVEVGGTASPPFVITDPPVTPPFQPPSFPPPAPQPFFPPPATSGPGGFVPTTPTIGGAPVAVAVAGISPGLFAFAMIAALAGAVGLRALADRATRRAAVIGAGATCSLERP